MNSTGRSQDRGQLLSKAEQGEPLKIARDGLEEHHVARRANARLLLDKGWSHATVSEALLIDDSTLRLRRKAFAMGGVSYTPSSALADVNLSVTVTQTIIATLPLAATSVVSATYHRSTRGGVSQFTIDDEGSYIKTSLACGTNIGPGSVTDC